MTEIQLQVLQLMGNDKNVHEIAKATKRSVRTIEVVRLQLKAYAKVKTLWGLVAWGVRKGFIEL